MNLITQCGFFYRLNVQTNSAALNITTSKNKMSPKISPYGDKFKNGSVLCQINLQNKKVKNKFNVNTKDIHVLSCCQMYKSLKLEI